MRLVGTHIERALLGAIAAENKDAGQGREKPFLIIESIIQSDWASATFVGATVAIAVRCEGHAAAVGALAARMGENLPECDIAISRMIVADLAVTQGELRTMTDGIVSKSLTVNALLICD
jgi:hypothetical protein